LGLAGTAGLLAVAVMLAFLAHRGDGPAPENAWRVLNFVRFLEVLAASATIPLLFIRWRAVGDAAALWAGSGLLVFVLLDLGLFGLVVPVGTGTTHVGTLVAVEVAGVLVTMALFAVGAAWPDVDASLRAAPVAMAAVATALALGLVISRLHLGAHLVTFTRAPRRRRAASGSELTALAWCSLATAYLVRGVRRRRAVGVALGLALLALSFAEVLGGEAHRSDDLWLLGAAFVRCLGLTIALVVASVDLNWLFRQQRGLLFARQVEVDAASMRVVAIDQVQRRQRHDVQNAILAVEGAASTLTRHYDRLGDSEREELRRMLGTGFGKLTSLVNDGGVEPTGTGFLLATALWPVWSELESLGIELSPTIAPGVRATGSAMELADVVRRLCQLAVDDSASPVAVTGGLTVRGPELRITYTPDFAGGPRRRTARRPLGSNPAAAGLPLRVAQQLLRAQGGDLEVDRGVGGELAFVVTLASAPERPPDDGRTT
jgi:hypothetical protein